jgi:hypothetical protein
LSLRALAGWHRWQLAGAHYVRFPQFPTDVSIRSPSCRAPNPRLANPRPWPSASFRTARYAAKRIHFLQRLSDVTSNKSYGDWGTIFADNVIASAILDRLLHHSTTVNIKGGAID